jgi:hypothetical protein
MSEFEDAEERKSRSRRLRDEIDRLRRPQSDDQRAVPRTPTPREFTDDAAFSTVHETESTLEDGEGSAPRQQE